MAKYHINPETGNANVCTAKVKCKFTSSEGVELPHYGTQIDAMKAAEEQLSGSLPTIQTLKNDVKVPEPVGDRRTEEQLSEEIADSSVKVQDSKERYSYGLRRLSRDLTELDKVVNKKESYHSAPFKHAFGSAVQTVYSIRDARRELLDERARLNEDELILEQKRNPQRSSDRAAAIAGLNPSSKDGRDLAAEMKKTLEDSEKELTRSKRATDNLIRRNQNGVIPMKGSFENVNDLSQQSNSMVMHARALRKLSNLAKSYEKAEAPNWRERGDLTAFEITTNEKKLAQTQTPYQIEKYSRLNSGIEMNLVRERFIKTLENDRKNLPKGPSVERSSINTGLRDNRAFLKHDQEQYEWGIDNASDTNTYSGYLGFK